MDLRLAIRRLRAAPGFTTAAVLTLALGIGANALTFGAIRGLLVQPLPFPDGDDLVWVQTANPALALTGQVVWSDELQALAAGMRSADGIAVIGSRALIRAIGQQRTEWRGLWVTPNLLSVIGLSPALGRSFDASDLHGGTPRPAMIGYERWQRDFGGDPAIVGRVIPFADNKDIVVIGVLPRGLELPFGRSPGEGSGIGYKIGVQDFWTLGQTRPDEYPAGTAIARLRAGTSKRAAQAEADAIFSRLARPQAADATRIAQLVTFRDYALGVMRPALPLLQAFAALVLLIACANLANLVLARAASARGEFAVRAALGARRRDVMRILIAESAVISVGGTAAGLLLAGAGRTLLVTFAADHVAAIDRIRIDGAVFVFTAILAALATAAFGLLPMTVFHETPAVSMLDRAARGQTIGRRQARTFRALVIVQVAVTLVLLNAAALLFQSLSRLMSVDTGYRPGGVVAADVLLFEPASVVLPYFQRLHERLTALPGVEAVGLVQSTPLTGKWTFRERLAVNGRPADPRDDLDIAGTFVAFDYFKAMGIPILAGRDFTVRDLLAGKGRQMILNDAAARLFFPGESAVGREMVLNGRVREVIGVVKGTRDTRLDTPVEPQFYQTTFTGSSQVIVRTSGDPLAFAGVLRRELTASDPRVIVKAVEPMTSIVEASVFERRLATRLLMVFAGLALTLAVVGLYGVLNFTTIQRRREIGVRAALGARRVDLVRMVLGEGLTMTLIGIGAGLLVSVAAAAWLQTLLFEVAPRDPLTAAIAVALLTITALAACTLPAWRAASVSPALTLRSE